MATKVPLIIFLGISIFFLIPLFFMLYGSLVPSFTSTAITSSFIIKAFTSSQTLPLLINTLEYGFLGGLLAVTLGTTYAWFMNRTDVPGKKFLNLLPILPLTLPLIVKGFAWIFLFSPTIGLANIEIERLFGINYPIFNIFSMPGMIFAWGVGGIPFTYLIMEAAFQSVDPSLEESSRTSGGGMLVTVRKVTLPLMIPAILSAYLLISIAGIENFDYPFILGSRAHLPTLATQVYTLVETNQSSLAAAYGILYLIMTMLLITVYIWITRKSFRYVVVTGKATQRTLFRLGKWKWPSLIVLLVIMFFAFVLPMFMIFIMSLVPYYTVGGNANPFATLTLANYFQAFTLPYFQEAVINSFTLSISAAILTTIVGTVMAYAMIKGKTRGKSLLNYISSLPLAFPGVVYAIALIWTFLIIPVFNTYIYGTIWVMLLGLMIIWLPYSIRMTSSALVQVSDELEEAASVLGSSWTRRFSRITIPLLKSGIVNSFIYVMVNSFRELGAVVLLYNSSSILLIIVIVNLFEQSAGSLPLIAALSTLMTVMLAASILVTRYVSRTKIRV